MKKCWLIIVILFSIAFSVSNPISFADDKPGISSEEILLGATYPQTGLVAGYYSSYFVGANAYFSYLNAQGGIYGRKIRLITFDDGNIPSRAIQGANQLILKDKVFALFSSTPSSASHKAMISAVNLGRRGVPDLFPIVSWSGFKDPKNYPTTFVLNPSAQQEARMIASFAKEEFPKLSFYATVQDNDLGVELKAAWSSVDSTVEKYSGFLDGMSPYAQIDDKAGGILFSSYILPRAASANPFVARSDAVSSINRIFEGPKSNWANTYAGLYVPLPNDTGDEFVTFFNKIFSTYASGETIDGKTIEGANAAYVLAQTLSAAGPQLTRQKVIDLLKTRANSFSHAGYEPLNFGDTDKANKASIYFARFDGTSWSRYSRNYSTELNSNIVTKTGTYRSTLLPNGLPIPISNTALVKTTLTCVKGKITKKVTGISPKCPTGYKKK